MISSFLPTSLLGQSTQSKKVQPRQAPAVIATSKFLRRGYQASVVVRNWVYIDGGEFSFKSNGAPRYQYASTLLSIDLSQNWTNATVKIQSTTKPDGAPNLNNPSLWYHESEDLIYSGFAGWNSSFGDGPNLPPFSLWTFKPDGTGSGAWNQIIPAQSSVWTGLTRPGIPLMAFDSTSAWVLGGTTSAWIGGAASQNLIPGMVQFDMGSRLFSNFSVQCCNAIGSIYQGALQYVPSFGPAGIHIAMGGRHRTADDDDDGSKSLIDFGTVSVFDPAKREWWNQTTTGSRPSPRVEFCTAGVNSTNGTYEIFVYAGWGTNLGPVTIQYDTINILTLPAFHWISVPYNPLNPRHGLSCNAVGGSQILTIGGVDSNAKIAYGTPLQNTKSTFNSSPDPFAQGLAVFDMTTLAFSDRFTAGAQPYEQSDVVKQFYSQSNGSYTSNLTPQVSTLLQVTHFTNSTSASSSNSSDHPTPTSSETSTPAPPPSHGLKAGTIAAIIISVVAGVLIIAGGIFYVYKRRGTRTTPSDQIILHEKDAAQVNVRTPPETEEIRRVQELGEPVDFRAIPEMVGTGRVHEFGDPDPFIPELDHRALPVELQAPRSYHQD